MHKSYQKPELIELGVLEAFAHTCGGGSGPGGHTCGGGTSDTRQQARGCCFMRKQIMATLFCGCLNCHKALS